MRVVWSPDAENDLDKIWNYLASEASVARADEMARKIVAGCSQLSDWPMSGRNRDNIAPGLRSIPAAPHVIFYRVAGQTVEIVRVIDGRRDIEAEFADMP